MADDIDIVFVDAEFDDYDSGGPTQFEEVELLTFVLESGERHVWFDGTHYTANTTAETVTVGDRFYTGQPEKQIYEVVEISESTPRPVKIEYLYPSGGASTDEITRETLTGLPPEEQPMGYLGPPNLLEEV